MEIATHYDPSQVETKWYQHWLKQGFFKATSNPHKIPYTLVMPPPNITGVLHMGHVLNNTIQDVLIRRARMQGFEACWVPGLDHASIATEAKVVAMLASQGIHKKDLTREAFLTHAWQWKEKYGNIILEQIKQLGASCDWDRLRFTLDPGPSAAVKKIFVQLYQQGYIYQGKRMVHWDPVGKTALSDDEVIYRPVASKLYYVAYQVVDSAEQVVVATTRPETILGDTALCVHPTDPRYQHLHNKQVMVPIAKRIIPIITDPYVDPTFGTGCLKVTPAHDANDYALSQKHHLPLIDILNEDATLSATAQHYVGEDRFVVRHKIAQALQQLGCLMKVEDYTSHVGFSERTDAVVEPRLSQQWFVHMQELAKPALAHVLDGTIQFYPEKLKHMYQSWLEHVQDWCISRQLWWGHRIPAFYLPDGTVLVAEDKIAALALAHAQHPQQQFSEADLRQDEDVLDTWFSAWLWPITVFDGFPNTTNEVMRYFYPTQVVVTAPEIIFFWIARMIMAGYAFVQQPPFKKVYFTGTVRDRLGRKMSKSLGNSPDPLMLIQQYGADGVRVGMMWSAPAGNDLLFDAKLCEQGSHFANKLWNAFRLIKGWQVTTTTQAEDDKAVAWFDARLNQALESIDHHFEQFRISDALKAIYKLIWDDFCAWYLEMIKPPYGTAIAPARYEATLGFLATLLKILHPFMPFITEEIWHQLPIHKAADCIIVAPWPQRSHYSEAILAEAMLAFTLITNIRNLKGKAHIMPKELVSLSSAQTPPSWFMHFCHYIYKLAGATPGGTIDQIEREGSIGCDVGGHLFYIAIQKNIAQEQELAQLKKELDYYQGFLEAVNKKLTNERFVDQAPATIIAIERKKQVDALAKIQLIRERLAALV